jgi:REP element-mobilizing transposase RayT
MGTFTQTLYQIVFSTKYRKKTLSKDERPELFKSIWGILKNNKGHLYRINGIEDHIHIITSLHPSVSLANLVKDIKLGSTSFIKEKKIFPNFGGWQDGYSAFTYSIDSKDNLIKYVKNQEEHHKETTFKEELIKLLNEHGIEFDEKYLD